MPLENLTFYLPEPERFIDESTDGHLVTYFNNDHPHFEGLFKKKTVAAFAIKLKTGIYQTGFNFEHIVKGFTKETTIKDYKYYFDKNGNLKEISNFNCTDFYRGFLGVADNVEQIEKYYSRVIEKNRVVISVTKVEKAKEPEFGGWRWHKWGPYIGTKKPICEYLRNEPRIKEVFCFHIHVLVD